MLGINARQQNAELGCNAWPGLLLQGALAQHPLQKGAVFKQAGPGKPGGKPMRKYTLEHRFPVWRKAAIEPDIRRKKRPLGSFAKLFDRPQLDFRLARRGYGGIRSVERTGRPAQRPTSSREGPRNRAPRRRQSPSWGRTEHPDRRRLVPPSPRRQKEPVEFHSPRNMSAGRRTTIGIDSLAGRRRFRAYRPPARATDDAAVLLESSTPDRDPEPK